MWHIYAWTMKRKYDILINTINDKLELVQVMAHPQIGEKSFCGTDDNPDQWRYMLYLVDKNIRT